MGCNLFARNSASSFSAEWKPRPANPDPNNWIITNSKQFGKFLLVAIRYPDCLNYEGQKILVFYDSTIEDLRKQKKIDPHFSDNHEYKSPIARFQPTPEGWDMAEIFIKVYNQKIKRNANK